MAGEKRHFKTFSEMEKKTDNPAGIQKNKGGRPRTKTTLFNRKLTLYLSDEEYDLLSEFLEHGWKDYNYSSAARFLLLRTLKQWEEKGKKQVGLRGDFK